MCRHLTVFPASVANSIATSSLGSDAISLTYVPVFNSLPRIFLHTMLQAFWPHGYPLDESGKNVRTRAHAPSGGGHCMLHYVLLLKCP
jgi:hypothetical protein